MKNLFGKAVFGFLLASLCSVAVCMTEVDRPTVTDGTEATTSVQAQSLSCSPALQLCIAPLARLTSLAPGACKKALPTSSTCGPLGTFPAGSSPTAIAFDGTNMWVTNYWDLTVTELSPSGAQIGTFAVPWAPHGITERNRAHRGPPRVATRTARPRHGTPSSTSESSGLNNWSPRWQSS